MSNGHGGYREGSGRPKGAIKDPSICKKERLTLNCTTEEKEKIVALAKSKNMSVSSLVINTLRKQFNKI